MHGVGSAYLLEDSPKRQNFISIQNGRTMHANGYHQMPCRTGFDKAVPYRVDNTYVVIAEEDGIVTKVTKNIVTVKYKSSEETYEIGKIYGKWSGKIIPHELVCSLKEGDKVKGGDVIADNKLFFRKDPLNPKQSAMVWGVLAKTAFMESRETSEDSSGMSKEFAQKLNSPMTHLRHVLIERDTDVLNLIPVGKEVLSDDILCTLAPPIITSSELFSDKSLASLQKVSSVNPVTKYSGVIDKYMVYYTGDIESMTKSVKALVEQSDHEVSRARKAMGRPAVTGKVPVGHRINGKPIGPDQVVLVAYITRDVEFGDADKAVLAGQLKSIIGKIYEHAPQTESGETIDYVFSLYGVDRRLVDSAKLMGSTNTLSLGFGKLFVEAYQK